MDWSSRQTSNKETVALYDLLEQIGLIDILGTNDKRQRCLFEKYGFSVKVTERQDQQTIVPNV